MRLSFALILFFGILNGVGAFLMTGHCDVVHAVEAHHGGKGDSSVLYIPAVPLTVHKCVFLKTSFCLMLMVYSANYIRDQRVNFLAGLPPPYVLQSLLSPTPYSDCCFVLQKETFQEAKASRPSSAVARRMIF